MPWEDVLPMFVAPPVRDVDGVAINVAHQGYWYTIPACRYQQVLALGWVCSHLLSLPLLLHCRVDWPLYPLFLPRLLQHKK